MISLWHRKEILVTNSPQKLSEVTGKLTARQIPYDTRSVNNGMGRSSISNKLVNPDFANTYYVYVHKNDYDAALATIHSR